MRAQPITRAITAASVLLLTVFTNAVPGQRTGQEPPPYQLTAMKVVPFSQRTNLFLDEIKNDNDFFAWNQLNLSLFVTIEVAGRAGSYNSQRKVEITAYEDGDVIL